MNKKEVYIVGGGTSLNKFDFSILADKDTIAVNKAITYVPSPNFFITMDYTFCHKRHGLDLKGFNSYNTSKIFIANFGDNILIEKEGRIIDSRFNLIYDLKEYNMIIKSNIKFGIGFSFNDFRCGNNSAYSALQFAVLMGYQEINLLGVDLVVIDNQTHFHKGYGETVEKFNNKLESYYQCFKQGIEEIQKQKDIEIYSYSKISRLNSIIPYKEINEQKI